MFGAWTDNTSRKLPMGYFLQGKTRYHLRSNEFKK